MANQVDGRDPNPPAQVTAHILEVAFVAQAYTADFQKIPDEFVKNGIPYDRQKADMAQATSADDNSMPWTGRSLRIYFLNYSRGAGCLLHSLGHEFEFRYNESRIYSPGQPYDGDSPHPWMQPLFRRFAGFDLATRYGAPFDSLYAGGDDYAYGDCNGAGVCDSLSYPAGNGYPAGTISGYQPACGNVHYAPGAAHGYDYEPQATVRSFCESFQKPAEAATALSFHNWDYITQDPAIDGDCGGKFLVYWYQNMPGLDNDAFDLDGAPMKNWWPFMYYLTGRGGRPPGSRLVRVRVGEEVLEEALAVGQEVPGDQVVIGLLVLDPAQPAAGVEVIDHGPRVRHHDRRMGRHQELRVVPLDQVVHPGQQRKLAVGRQRRLGLIQDVEAVAAEAVANQGQERLAV